MKGLDIGPCAQQYYLIGHYLEIIERVNVFSVRNLLAAYKLEICVTVMGIDLVTSMILVTRHTKC